MTKGEVSKAFRTIVFDARVLPYSLNGLQFLQSKNPAAATPGEAPWNWDEEYICCAEAPIPIAFEGVVDPPRRALLVEWTIHKKSAGKSNHI